MAVDYKALDVLAGAVEELNRFCALFGCDEPRYCDSCVIGVDCVGYQAGAWCFPHSCKRVPGVKCPRASATQLNAAVVEAAEASVSEA